MRASTIVFYYLVALSAYELSQSASAKAQPSEALPDSKVSVAEKDVADEFSRDAIPAIAPPEIATDSPIWSNYQQTQLEVPQDLPSAQGNHNAEATVIQPELILETSSQNHQIAEELPTAITTVSIAEPSALTDYETAESSPSTKEQPMQELEPLALDDPSEPQQSQELETEVLDSLPEQLPESENQLSDSSDSPDPLGEIEIVSRPRREPVVQLLLRPSVVTSSDLSIVNNSNTADNNLVFTTGAFLLATPELGADTRLIALAGGELIRYGGQDDGYNSLDLSLGIQQRLGQDTYAQLGWAQRQLFEQDGDREFVDNSAQLAILHQERLGERLRLNGFYELRFSLVDTSPRDQDRLRNTIGARLGYGFTPQLEGAIDYRAVHESVTSGGNFTGIRQQISAIATYRPNQNLSISGAVSYLVGPSYTFEGNRDSLNNILVQLNIGINLPLF